MRPAILDEDFTFDDPNLYWGDPSYILEPGDPGYVPVMPFTPLETQIHKHTMSSNPTPRNEKVLRSLAQDIADGLHTIEDVIGMKQNKEANIRPALAKLEGDPAAPAGSAARKGCLLVYEQCKTLSGDAQSALGALSDGAVKDFLQAASDVLSGILGGRWSNAWMPTGFPDHSTAVPRTQEKRFSLLMSLHNYFVANPTHELNQPPHRVVTAAVADALHTQMSDARTAVNTASATQQIAKNSRDADVNALFDRISGTIGEAGQVLADDSPQWETLGLNIPAHPSPPEAVTDLTVSTAGPARLLAEWPRARRANYYRVFIQIVGTDADFRHLDNTDGLELLIKELPTGATVRVKVKSANDGGEAAEFSPVREGVVG